MKIIDLRSCYRPWLRLFVSHSFSLLKCRETLLEEDVVDEVELVGEEPLDEDGKYRQDEGPARK